MSKDKEKKLKDEKEKKSKKDKKNLKDKQSKKGSKDAKKKKGSAKSKKSSSKNTTSNVIFEIAPVSNDNDKIIEPIAKFAKNRKENELDDANDLEIDEVTGAEIEAILENETDAFDEAYEEAVEEAIDDKPQLAADLFQSAYSSSATNNEEIRLSCAQAVLLPYSKKGGLKEAQSLGIGRGFAMGMMNDSTCGALIAAIMLAGLAGAPLEAASNIFDEFQKRYGSTFCKDILEGPSTCRDIIKHACLLYEKFALNKGALDED